MTLISVNLKSQTLEYRYFDKTNLKREVKSLKQTFVKDYLEKPGYWYTGHVWKPISTVPYTISYFNKLGKIIEGFNNDSSKTSNYKYNDIGNLIQRIKYSIYNDTLKYTYEYNNLGLLVEEYIFQENNKDTVVKVYEYKYNLKKQLIESIKYSYGYMVYDDLDKDRTIYKYDSLGRVIESDHYIHDSIHFTLSTYVYDQKEKVIQENTELFLYDYDMFVNNEKKWVITYKYDNRIEESRKGGIIIEYEYDDKGNWILER